MRLRMPSSQVALWLLCVAACTLCCRAELRLEHTAQRSNEEFTDDVRLIAPQSMRFVGCTFQKEVQARDAVAGVSDSNPAAVSIVFEDCTFEDTVDLTSPVTLMEANTSFILELRGNTFKNRVNFDSPIRSYTGTITNSLSYSVVIEDNVFTTAAALDDEQLDLHFPQMVPPNGVLRVARNRFDFIAKSGQHRKEVVNLRLENRFDMDDIPLYTTDQGHRAQIVDNTVHVVGENNGCLPQITGIRWKSSAAHAVLSRNTMTLVQPDCGYKAHSHHAMFDLAGDLKRIGLFDAQSNAASFTAPGLGCTMFELSGVLEGWLGFDIADNIALFNCTLRNNAVRYTARMYEPDFHSETQTVFQRDISLHSSDVFFRQGDVRDSPVRQSGATFNVFRVTNFTMVVAGDHAAAVEVIDFENGAAGHVALDNIHVRATLHDCRGRLAFVVLTGEGLKDISHGAASFTVRDSSFIVSQSVTECRDNPRNDVLYLQSPQTVYPIRITNVDIHVDLWERVRVINFESSQVALPFVDVNDVRVNVTIRDDGAESEFFSGASRYETAGLRIRDGTMPLVGEGSYFPDVSVPFINMTDSRITLSSAGAARFAVSSGASVAFVNCHVHLIAGTCTRGVENALLYSDQQLVPNQGLLLDGGSVTLERVPGLHGSDADCSIGRAAGTVAMYLKYGSATFTVQLRNTVLKILRGGHARFVQSDAATVAGFNVVDSRLTIEGTEDATAFSLLRPTGNYSVIRSTISAVGLVHKRVYLFSARQTFGGRFDVEDSTLSADIATVCTHDRSVLVYMETCSGTVRVANSFLSLLTNVSSSCRDKPSSYGVLIGGGVLSSVEVDRSVLSIVGARGAVGLRVKAANRNGGSVLLRNTIALANGVLGKDNKCDWYVSAVVDMEPVGNLYVKWISTMASSFVWVHGEAYAWGFRNSVSSFKSLNVTMVAPEPPSRTRLAREWPAALPYVDRFLATLPLDRADDLGQQLRSGGQGPLIDLYARTDPSECGRNDYPYTTFVYGQNKGSVPAMDITITTPRALISLVSNGTVQSSALLINHRRHGSRDAPELIRVALRNVVLVLDAGHYTSAFLSNRINFGGALQVSFERVDFTGYSRNLIDGNAKYRYALFINLRGGMHPHASLGPSFLVVSECNVRTFTRGIGGIVHVAGDGFNRGALHSVRMEIRHSRFEHVTDNNCLEREYARLFAFYLVTDSGSVHFHDNDVVFNGTGQISESNSMCGDGLDGMNAMTFELASPTGAAALTSARVSHSRFSISAHHAPYGVVVRDMGAANLVLRDNTFNIEERKIPTSQDPRALRLIAFSGRRHSSSFDLIRNDFSASTAVPLYCIGGTAHAGEFYSTTLRLLNNTVGNCGTGLFFDRDTQAMSFGTTDPLVQRCNYNATAGRVLAPLQTATVSKECDSACDFDTECFGPNAIRLAQGSTAPNSCECVCNVTFDESLFMLSPQCDLLRRPGTSRTIPVPEVEEEPATPTRSRSASIVVPVDDPPTVTLTHVVEPTQTVQLPPPPPPPPSATRTMPLTDAPPTPVPTPAPTPVPPTPAPPRTLTKTIETPPPTTEEPPPPPPPPIIPRAPAKGQATSRVMAEALPQGAATGVATSGSTAVAVGGAVNPSAANKGANLANIVGIVDCAFSEDSLETSPMEVLVVTEIGSSEFRFLAGGTATSLGFVVGSLGLQVILFYVAKQARALRRYAAAFSALVISYMMPNVASYATTMAVHGTTPAIKAMAAIAFTVLALTFFGPMYIVLVHMSGVRHVEDIDDLADHRMYPFLVLADGCRDTTTVSLRLLFFEDMLVAIVLGMIAGWQPTDVSCEIVAAMLTFVAFLHLVYVLLKRPFREHVDSFFALVIAIGQVALAIVTIVVIRTEQGVAVMAYLALGMGISFMLQAVCTGVWAGVVYMRRRAKKKLRMKEDSQSASQALLAPPAPLPPSGKEGPRRRRNAKSRSDDEGGAGGRLTSSGALSSNDDDDPAGVQKPVVNPLAAGIGGAAPGTPGGGAAKKKGPPASSPDAPPPPPPPVEDDDL